jgi:hypothetical protein
VRELKRADGPELRTLGSVSLVQHLLAAGLVDRLTLVVCPLALPQTGSEPIFAGLPDSGCDSSSTRVLPGCSLGASCFWTIDRPGRRYTALKAYVAKACLAPADVASWLIPRASQVRAGRRTLRSRVAPSFTEATSGSLVVALLRLRRFISSAKDRIWRYLEAGSIGRSA